MDSDDPVFDLRSPYPSKRGQFTFEERANVMEPNQDRDWTAQIVIYFDHAGLRPIGLALADELRHVLARVDDPRLVASYLTWLKYESEQWLKGHPLVKSKK